MTLLWNRNEDGNHIRRLYIVHYAHHLRTVQHRKSSYRPSPLYDGGIVGGKQHPPLWPRIADHLTEHDLPAFGYLTLAFAAYSRTPPMPDELLSCLSPKRAREKLDEELEQQTMYYRHYLGTLNTSYILFHYDHDVSENDAALMAIFENPYTPLFKVTRLALIAHDTSTHLHDAIAEYLRWPDVYDRIYREELPSSVRRQAYTKIGVASPPRRFSVS